MAAANGDVKVTTNNVEVLVDLIENNQLRVTAVTVEVLYEPLELKPRRSEVFMYE